MTLGDFLTTANEDDLIALQEAKDFKVIQPRLISPDMMLSFITEFGLVDALIDNPTTNEGKGVRAAFKFGSEFNIMEGSSMTIEPKLDLMISEGIIPEDFKTVVKKYANPEVEAFPNINLHQVKLERGNLPLKSLSLEGSFVIVEVSSICENHNPRILAYNPRIDLYQRVTSFYNVSDVRKYDAKIPNEWFSYDLFVEDAYGVFD